MKYEYYDANDDNRIATHSGSYIAQTFTPSVSHLIKTVNLYLYKEASATGTITISIKAVSSGIPIGTDLCSVSFELSTLTTSPAWHSYDFSSPIVVNSGTQYAIVIVNTGAIPNEIYWRCDGSSPTYSGGAAVVNASLMVPDTDFLFEESGDAVGGLFFCMG